MKQSIPFNLERAKAGDPILLDGKPASFLMYVTDADPNYRVVVKGDNGAIFGYTENGRRCDIDKKPCLTMAPKKRMVWVNMYPLPSDVCGYETKEDADHGAGVCRIACVRVEFEEGEGL